MVELRIKPSHDLNAVHRSILADNCVEHDFALHVSLDQFRRIFGIRLLHGNRAGNQLFVLVRRAFLLIQLGKVHDPTASRAGQVRQVDVQRVNLLARKDFFRRQAWIELAHVRRAFPRAC